MLWDIDIQCSLYLFSFLLSCSGDYCQGRYRCQPSDGLCWVCSVYAGTWTETTTCLLRSRQKQRWLVPKSFTFFSRFGYILFFYASITSVFSNQSSICLWSWSNPHKPGLQCRALCGTVCALSIADSTLLNWTIVCLLVLFSTGFFVF